MPRAKADPDDVAKAAELRALGCSFREIGQTLGVTATTVKRWLDEPPPAPANTPPAALPAHMAVALAPPVVPLDMSDPVAMIAQLIAEQHAAIAADRAAGNMRAVSSNMSTLERMTKTLKQLQAGAADDANTVRISRAEISKIEDSLRERVAAICNRPLLCAECSRKLSVQWGVGVTPPGA